MEWKEVYIKDICTVLGDGLHGTPEYDEKGNFYFINGNNLQEGHITIKKDTKRVSQKEFLKYKKELNDRSILVSINGTIGNVAKYNNEPCILGKSACFFNVKEDIDRNFIYYVISSAHFKKSIIQQATGTTIKNVSLKQMRDYHFLIPVNLSDQRKIAGILSALDSKIENNNKINANLEAQAQALFKSWFVDFTPFKDQPFVDSELGPIPQGWKVGTLGEFFPIVTGKKDANISSKSGKYPFFSCSQNISWTNDYSFDGFAIIVAGNGDFNVKWYNGKFEAYQRTYVLIPYNPTLTSWLYYAVKYNLNMITIGARGSVIKFITKGDIQNFKVAYPQNIDKHEIVKMLGKINKDIEHNKNEVSCLAKLRDTLLPKLMSGEIKL